MNKKIAVIGASGYTGAQVSALIYKAKELSLYGIYVSEHSDDKHKSLFELYPQYPFVTQALIPLTENTKSDIAKNVDGVILATDHKVSLHLAAWFYEQGISVFDLSGAYRFADINQYPKWYGFKHLYPNALANATYGLAEWNNQNITNSKLIAVAGCYPTASLLALKPIKHLLTDTLPIINAVSGVTGAGRKAQISTSFCEVSLTPYGVLNHRHQPEIATYLEQEVIFTPHLGNFKRGILATITAQLLPNTQLEDIQSGFSCYNTSAIVNVLSHKFPKIDDVVGTPHCLIGWKYDPQSHYIVITSAIDNLMKGAASQALQCIDIHFGLSNSLNNE